MIFLTFDVCSNTDVVQGDVKIMSENRITSLNVGAVGVRHYPTSGPKVADVNFRAKWSHKTEQFDFCWALTDVK